MGTSIRLADLNEFIRCPVCQGYLIDATTINECLHTFCKSCIVKHIKNNNNECPKCNTVIHERRPLDYITYDRNKQDIVYKLVPQLYISELSRKFAVQDLPDLDSPSKVILKKKFIYVVLVQRKRNSPINSVSSPTQRTNEPTSKCQNPIYLKCPATVRVSHLRKLLAVKFQLQANDRVSIIYKGDTVSDFDQVSNLAQSLSFCLQYEISRITSALEQGCSTSTSSYESASTSSSLTSIETTIATVSTSTNTIGCSGDEMCIDEPNIYESNK